MKKILIVILALGLGACASAPEPKPKLKPVAPVSVWNDNNISQLHSEWHGVPYRLGGGTKSGIDCSAFVSVAYEKMVGMTLPRTVREQQRLGHTVPRNQLRKGDLVFFKTGKSTHHVGIYVGSDNFLHVSTSQGVKISSLHNVYWASKYWNAKRISRI
ncbi:MAG: NlpC/P60 family protein [Shewanella sp.]|uniref:NlpC/P60 family protein n=1 Tax=Shewanella sp. SNU WT4 TaxID=2590015 RepID=UPI001128B5BF|nr:NlpC/P60 family protein [Shewanella sp. SNU WT4]QDF66928.1 peptidase P60 [Shewanella sp. SNU WT4]